MRNREIEQRYSQNTPPAETPILPSPLSPLVSADTNNRLGDKSLPPEVVAAGLEHLSRKRAQRREFQENS